MNCPNCGAENEVGARFCVECGAPLETQLNLPDRPPEADEDDSDRTIMSSMSRIAEEAKTMAVTQDQLAAAEAEAASSFDRPPEPEPIPVPPSAAGSGSSGGGAQGFMTQRNIIIAVIVILLLCCCCCALGVGASVGSDPDAFEDLIRELSSLSLQLWIV
ncbi:MAG: zinc ribbon domain-containing protein [Anaerolineales bacterium]|nr:zinc ribbon domain-containing protein [Anaerolineales bacterium]